MSNKPQLASFWQNKLIQDSGSTLGSLLVRAAQLTRHQEIVRGSLDKNCQKHCWLANYHNNILYLQSDTAAWATRIRMQQHAVIKRLSANTCFKDIRAMRICVRPRYKKPLPKIKAKPLSDLTLAHLRQSNAGIHDSKLRSAMEKLTD